MVAFLPIAFGRVVIAHIGKINFTTRYRIQETGHSCSFSEEPIFIEAIKIATESYHTGLVPRELFSAVALRSAELDAVNKALNNGDVIDGASFNDVVFSGYKTLCKRKWFKQLFG
ncbi:MAG TPA: hypothetical protein VIY48_13940 [Candidatus Paceibacterota bacterium]